jgi:RNA polymerase sigma-70 factor (family 1)
MPFETRTEKELLLLASAGDQHAFEIIFNSYKDKLYSFVFRLSRSAETTEDIIQETFLKLWKDKEHLREIDHFSGYLFLMSKHQCINALKRFAKETQIIAEMTHSAKSTSDTPDNIFSLKEIKQRLHDSLQELPPQQKLVYTLSRDHGLKHSEIAGKLNISSSTVKNHIIQALRTIRQKVSYHPDSIISILFLFFLG